QMKTLQLTFKINTDPHILYRALVMPQTIELWSGFPAVMSETPGSEFEWFDGDIVGKNLEFDPGKMLKQQWFFGEDHPPSLVTLTLHEGKNKTEVELYQTNIPDEAFENIKYGWKNMIMSSLKEFFSD
ncbi:MAG: SRPBCC domain-containing protein, partial [Bacteroidota bacterium]